jgi:putative tricarboxylic transport membrane protein
LIVRLCASKAHAPALCAYKKVPEDALISPHAGHAGLIQRLVRKRDFYAGLLMIFFGLVLALKGPSYRLGTLMHMGPGFLPTALGALLICLGIAISVSAIPVPEGEDEDILPEHREWFAWACILCSPLAFMLFGSFFGLAPGTFACVFVAALGDREITLKNAALLSLLISVAGVALFSYVLQIPMPVFTWRGL